MRTDSIGSSPLIAWEPLKTDPIISEDTFVGCFESSSKPEIKTYSLAELYEQRDSFQEKTASELVVLWKNFKSIDLNSPGLYTRFQAWRQDLDPLLFHQVTQEKMLEEISGRFLSGRSISDAHGHLSQLLDTQVVDHVINDILWRVHKAQCYHNAKLAGLHTYKDFDRKLIRALCTCPYDKITSFFEEAREFKIAHKHLFERVDFSGVPTGAQEKLKEQARLSGTKVLSLQEIEQIRIWATEYNEILKTCKIQKLNWLSETTSQKDAAHGYRLAALYLHPDHNPAGRERFERLTELAEKLGIKNA